jgi:hypothetical protein
VLLLALLLVWCAPWPTLVLLLTVRLQVPPGACAVAATASAPISTLPPATPAPAVAAAAATAAAATAAAANDAWPGEPLLLQFQPVQLLLLPTLHAAGL